MKTKPFLKAAAIVLSIATVSGISATPFNSTTFAGVTLDDSNHDAEALKILDASIEALGGKEKLSSVKYMKQTGTISIPMAGIEGTIKLNIASPAKMLLIVDIPMMGKTLQGLNNGVVWSTDAMNGPRIIPADEAKDQIKQADLLRVLNFRENNKKILYMIETMFDERPAHQIRLIDHDDQVSVEYYSVKTGLLIGTETESMTPMGKIKATTIIKEYIEQDGFMLPTVVIQKAGPTSIHFEFSSVDFSEIEDSTFEFPAAINALIKATKAKEEAAP